MSSVSLYYLQLVSGKKSINFSIQIGPKMGCGQMQTEVTHAFVDHGQLSYGQVSITMVTAGLHYRITMWTSSPSQLNNEGEGKRVLNLLLSIPFTPSSHPFLVVPSLHLVSIAKRYTVL